MDMTCSSYYGSKYSHWHDCLLHSLVPSLLQSYCCLCFYVHYATKNWGGRSLEMWVALQIKN